MSGREQHYISEAFRSNWIAPLGPLVNSFEEQLAERIGVRGAAAVSSGTAAIHLALRLLEIKEGDSVFCQSFTFVATANPILYEKAVPVFIDSEPETWNMSPRALERALEDAKRNGTLPKAVIAVNLYGQSAKMDDIVSLCDAYGVPVIEDAAESLGTVYKGSKAGHSGASAFFHLTETKSSPHQAAGCSFQTMKLPLKKRDFSLRRHENRLFIISTAKSGTITD